jgi:hypothetical protein
MNRDGKMGSIPPLQFRFAMPMLPSRHYVSTHTQFIRDLIAAKPEIPDKQREGRAIWWDKTPDDLSEERRMDEGRVRQTAYVYQDE